MSNEHFREVSSGERFKFGANWTRFLKVLDDERIDEATKSLQKILEIDTLEGKTFLDIGSGSGLFSLAARLLGAKVHSFDYDPQSVVCADELRRRYLPNDANWTIAEASVLDIEYLKSLGEFDVVYSWGVLHHTGAMWQALENVSLLKYGREQLLFISIYNDQGNRSKRWRSVKRFYNSGCLGKTFVSVLFIPYFIIGGLAVDVLRGKNPVTRYTEYKRTRGMSRVCDWFDWLGGYPFEVAKPEEIFIFFKKKGYVLEKLKTCGGGPGCNEFVFQRTVEAE